MRLLNLSVILKKS